MSMHIQLTTQRRRLTIYGAGCLAAVIGVYAIAFDRAPTPEQIAETIAFLASPHNSVTRGALVPVYGKS